MEVLSDRACESCRRRRVKCDKRLPSCKRCELRGQPCAGYKAARTFLDESSKVRRKYDSARQSYRRGQTISFVSSDRDESCPNGQTTEDGILTDPDSLGDQHDPTHELDQFPSLDAPALPSALGGISANPDHNPGVYSALPASQTLGRQDAARLLQHQQSFLGVSPDSIWASSTSEDDFFDLDIDSYYANGNNACGFIPGVPVILSDTNDSDYSSGNDYLTPNWAEDHVKNHESIPHDSSDRWKEATVLLRHFVEVISPWMDIFDLDAYFGRILPHKAKRSSMIRATIAAVAAKQIAQMIENQSLHATTQRLSSVSAELDDFERANWYYKAANYYDAGISYLRLNLQRTDIGSPAPMESPFTSRPDSSEQRRNTNQHSSVDMEDMFSTIAVFSLYEALNGYADEWTHHLAGFQSLLRSQSHSNSLNSLGSSANDHLASLKVVRAAFWSIARGDIAAAYVRQSRMQLDPQDMNIWSAAGLKMLSSESSDSMAMIDSSTSIRHSTPSQVREDDVCRTLVWIVSRVMNFSVASSREKTFLEWNELRGLLEKWHNNLPPLFQPYASMPVTEEHPNAKPRFTRLLYSVPMCAAAWQLYHFAQILLLMNRPMDDTDGIGRLRTFRKISEESNNHSRQICSIALGRNSPAASRQMVYPLHLAGSCLENNEDRSVILGLLREIQIETGLGCKEWPVDGRRNLL